MQMAPKGPTCLIQFAIWECGTLDFQRLEEMLKQCIQFGVHDLMMEYHLLTTPISLMPSHYSKGVNSPLHSAPVSPRFAISATGGGVFAYGLMSCLVLFGGLNEDLENDYFNWEFNNNMTKNVFFCILNY